MKKVALLADGWRRLVTYAWVDGIMKRAEELDEQICLYYFSTNGTWSRDRKFNSGEYTLYELAEVWQFDGIIFDCTNMVDQEQIKKLVDRLKKTDVPVVSIGYDMDGFYYVGNDNKRQFRKVIDHLYEQHGCRSFVFAGGPDFHYENQMRFLAFKEAMADYGIPLTEDMCLFGDFDFGTGVRYMEMWQETKRPLPDAFVCANDNIAAGICSAAARFGYKIPEDFMVTGFDDLDKAAYFNPQITTVGYNRTDMGKMAIQVLADLWAGKKVKKEHFLSANVVPAESCGCPNTGRVDYREYIKHQIEYSVKTDNEAGAVMELQNRIEECTEYVDLYREISDHIQAMDCDGAYFVVNKELEDARLDCELPKSGYDSDREIMAYANEKKKGDLAAATVEELREYMDQAQESTIYMFSSLHFRDEIVGYTILKNPRFLYDNPALFDIHSVFMKKLENLYKQKILEKTNKKLRELYNRDSLTGLYNRVACNEMAVPEFERLKQAKIGCTMVFFDVDDFKHMNDTKGHRYGDEVLKKIAWVLEGSKPDDGIVYRFGGDEFIVFYPGTEEADDFIKEVSERLSGEQIYVSYGVIFTNPESNQTFEDYIAMADKKMYDLKQDRKKQKKEAFLKGVDISSLPELKDGGAAFFDQSGRKTDVFAFLKQNQVNSIRLRIWNDPAAVPEAKGYCDLAHTCSMAKRIRENGMHFVLDFHYSDFWADPGQQKKPHKWEKLGFEELKKAVYDYTAEVLLALKVIGCTPDMVQVGNEIRSGMLFPDGAVPNYRQLAELVNAGIRAVREYAPDTEVMIHLDQGGRYYYLKEWFDAMFDAGMEKIDAIGISFYSFWHGTYMDLRDTMQRLIERYRLPVYVVETAHPWRHCDGEHVSKELMETAGLPAGIEEQKKALSIIMQIAATAAGNAGKTGVYYWEPVCAPERGFGSWNENMGMFDEKCAALPGWDAYREFDREHPPIQDLDGFIEQLYAWEEDAQGNAGENLIPNGDFKNGTEGWWCSTKPEDVCVETTKEGLYISSDTNFDFTVERQIYIRKPGNYQFLVDYRGTNTTGVEVTFFLKEIGIDGEVIHEKRIYPSDVRFVTHKLDEPLDLKAGHISVGVKMHTPPVFAKIRKIALISCDETVR